jgi:hypothetical protein
LTFVARVKPRGLVRSTTGSFIAHITNRTRRRRRRRRRKQFLPSILPGITQFPPPKKKMIDAQ